MADILGYFDGYVLATSEAGGAQRRLAKTPESSTDLHSEDVSTRGCFKIRVQDLP